MRIFHLPSCKSCIKVIHQVLPSVAQEYGEKVKWEYIDISDRDNYRRFLRLEEKRGKQLGTPTILIGEKVLTGVAEIADSLKGSIEEELKARAPVVVLDTAGVDLLERFRTFGPWAVIAAGLIDGFNPCAFTVIVFFISFLTLAGYRRREMAVVGSVYIFSIFATYVALGFGIFRALYTLKAFYAASKTIYLSVGGLSLFLGALAVRDYLAYKRTGSSETMALQLPRVIKNKIHAVVGNYYGKDRRAQKKALFGLIVSSFVTGFLVCLLEAVCTGQLYLPTIVFVVKEGSLRGRALFYLIVYNLMFILPLVAILLFALFGATTRQFEAVARKHLGSVKLAMAAVFFVLGIVLWVGM